jgi:charged multivesicular body protein 1
MGNKPSMEDELINLKLTSKQMVMASKKCEKNHQKQLKAVEKAIKQGNREGAQIYAQNAIREKTQGMNYLRLSSRLDAVGARLETAVRTKQVRVRAVLVRAGCFMRHVTRGVGLSDPRARRRPSRLSF